MFLLRGIHAMSKGRDPLPDFAESEKTFDEVIRLKPDTWDVWERRGRLKLQAALYRLQRGDDAADLFRKAEEDLGEALRYRRDFEDAWLTRGILRTRRARDSADLDAAVEDLEQAARAQPRNAEIRTRSAEAAMARAALREREKRFPQAAEDYERAARHCDEALRIDSNREPLLSELRRAAREKAESLRR